MLQKQKQELRIPEGKSDTRKLHCTANVSTEVQWTQKSEPKNESIIDGHVASCSAPNGTLLNSAKKDCITISSMNGRIIELTALAILPLACECHPVFLKLAQ